MKQTILLEDLDQICSSNCIDFQKLYHKTVLVTGATGLIGSMIVRALLHYNDLNDADIHICVMARNRQKLTYLFGEACIDSRLHAIYGDITEMPELDLSVDFLIHCAANTNSGYMVSHPAETLHTAYEGTRNMLELAVRSSLESMVFVSSMEAYGITSEADNPITEEKLGFIDIHDVRSSYSEGKRICELLCCSYYHEYGVPVRIARPAQTFGAGTSPEDSRIFSQFAHSLIDRKDIVLHTKGETTANYCYTADTIEGILCLLTNGVSGETYNIVNETTSMTIRNAAELIAKNTCLGKISVIYDIPESNVYGYAPDTSLKMSAAKIRSLGWEPHYSLIQMYERMTEYWKQTGQW